MDTSFVYEWPLWATGALILTLLLLAIEFGLRTGLRKRRSNEKAGDLIRGDVTLGAMLALLGLLLAFTYAFSLGRADLRKKTALQEANAISNAFLRTDFASEPGRTALEGDVPRFAKASIVNSVKDVLNVHTLRLAAALDRIPGVVLALIVLVASTALATTAYNAGLRGTLFRLRMSAFAFVLAALIVIIIDFDMPLHGLITVSDESIAALIPDMEAALANR
jgi:hypothetical protein